MNTLIISGVAFVAILITVTILLFKTNNLKKYNIFIYASLFVFWLAMQLFKQNTGNMQAIQALNSRPWIWPVILASYQFTQVVVRIPFGIISSKTKSRKIVIQIVAIAFIVAATCLVASNFALWSIIVAMIAAGMVGATFGLNSQYWSENWDIKKVFWSSVIMFTIPTLTSSLANIISKSIHNPGGLEVSSIRWIILAALIIEIAYVIFYSLIKEKKETIGLDLGAPEEVMETSKGYSMVWKLSISAAIVALLSTLMVSKNVMQGMGINDSMDRDNLNSLILVVSIVAAVVAGTYLVKTLSIQLIKILSFALVAIGSVVGLGLAVSGIHSAAAWLIASLLITTGAVIFQVTLFGSTLHLDHKHPALVLGIFLTVRSFAFGTGQLISDELIVNTNVSKVALPAIFGLATAISVFGIGFFAINRIKMNNYYKIIQSYEFNFS